MLNSKLETCIVDFTECLFVRLAYDVLMTINKVGCYGAKSFTFTRYLLSFVFKRSVDKCWEVIKVNPFYNTPTKKNKRKWIFDSFPLLLVLYSQIKDLWPVDFKRLFWPLKVWIELLPVGFLIDFPLSYLYPNWP